MVGEAGSGGGKSIYIAVDDADAAYARARKAGATIIQELITRDYGSREFICRDPEGNVWDVAWKRGSVVSAEGDLTWAG